LNKTIAVAVLAALSFTACAQDKKPADIPAPAAAAKAACASPKTPPKELVKKDLAPGTGRDIKFRSAIVVHYTGWLYDECAPDNKGKMFDTSATRGTPFGLMVGAGKVIKGWDEGLVGMKEKNAKRLLIIPPDKGYGEKGTGNGLIPPNSTLVFEIETLQIIHQPEEGAPAPKQ